MPFGFKSIRTLMQAFGFMSIRTHYGGIRVGLFEPVMEAFGFKSIRTRPFEPIMEAFGFKSIRAHEVRFRFKFADSVSIATQVWGEFNSVTLILVE